MQWPLIYVVLLVKKNWYALNTLVCTRGKEITKKRNVYAVRVIFHPCVVLTPRNPLLPVVHVGSGERRNHSCTISAQWVQRQGARIPPISLFPIHSDHDPYLALPWYTVMRGTLGRPYKMFWLPEQVNPSPVYPDRQVQAKLPTVLLQLAWALQPPLSVEHSSTSVSCDAVTSLQIHLKSYWYNEFINIHEKLKKTQQCTAVYNMRVK